MEDYYRIKDESIWITQKAMAELFGVNVPDISKHLSNIYDEGELIKEATVSKMEIVQREGNQDVKRTPVFYNLDAINWQLDLETYIRQREPEQSELIVQTKVQRDLFQSAIIALWNNV